MPNALQYITLKCIKFMRCSYQSLRSDVSMSLSNSWTSTSVVFVMKWSSFPFAKQIWSSESDLWTAVFPESWENWEYFCNFTELSVSLVPLVRPYLWDWPLLLTLFAKKVNKGVREGKEVRNICDNPCQCHTGQIWESRYLHRCSSQLYPREPAWSSCHSLRLWWFAPCA